MINKQVKMNIKSEDNIPHKDPSVISNNSSDPEFSSDGSISTLTGNSVIHLENRSTLLMTSPENELHKESNETVTEMFEENLADVEFEQGKSELQILKQNASVKSKTIKFKRKRFIGDKIRYNNIKHCKTKRIKRKTVERVFSFVAENKALAINTSSQRLIKKALAKENLLDESNNSRTSFVIVKNYSFTSRKQTNSDQGSASDNSPEMQKSVILLAERSEFPFKSDVINVALAQINNKVNNEVQFMNKITAEPSEENYWRPTDKVSASDVTLTNIENNEGASFSAVASDDQYEFAKTSSEFQSQQSIDKTLTNSESNINVYKDHVDNREDKIMREKLLKVRPSLLDTVINLGFFQEKGNLETPHVIVSPNFAQIQIPTHKYDEGKQKQNILTKTVEDTKHFQAKKIALPDQEAITGMIVNEKEKVSNTHEFKDHYPTTLPELWDRLKYVVELAVKKVEETLTEKILAEIRKNNIEKPTEVIVEPKITQSSTNATMQCDLVPNQVIDEIAMNLSLDGTRTETLSSSIKSLKLQDSELIKDLFKGTLVKMPLGQGDVVEVATATDSGLEGSETFRRLVYYVRATAEFVRENAIVIVSVPSFIVILLLMYGFYILYVYTL